MQRQTKPIRRRHSTLFHHRIVITLPPWAVFVMTGAIALGLLNKPLLVTNIIALITTVIAVVCVYVARREVRQLRYDVHEALNNINNDYPEDEEELAEPIQLRPVNGRTASRLSEPR